MTDTAIASAAAWQARDLEAGTSWIFVLDDKTRRDMTAAVRKARDPHKILFDYRCEDFDFGSAWPVIAAAFAETKRGRGIARRQADEIGMSTTEK